MGSTLEHGIYLPSEGEKNCYQGLASNWNKVDGALGDVAGLKQLIESKFTKEIVTELPTEDINPYCIYMILKTDPETNNIYDEWVYINNAWEYLGNTQVDMTQYYTKQEVNELPAVASGVTSTKVGNYDTHLADSNIHVTSADKTKWNTVALIKQLRLVNAQVGSATTIAFANIDDTNGIKVGDKCMDLDAKMFEITAVDTTNQTVTVGSALIDLALDANVVHTNRNETISGDKVFNNRLIKNIDVVLGTAPSTGKFSNIDIADNNKASLLQILGGVYDTGNSYVRFFVQNKTADDGTGLSPTGTIRACGFNINLPATSTSEGQGSITPRANKTTDFGLLSYQWRNLWCEKLFLNGTQLDPSAFALDNAVVHLSESETITGAKYFKVSPQIYNSDSTASEPNLVFKNSKYAIGDTTNTGEQRVIFVDKNNAWVGYVSSSKNIGGTQQLIFRVYNKDSNDTGISSTISFYITKNGDRYFTPYEDSQINLGSISAKWKSFNGLTPSSLSLPDFSNRVNIAGYISNLTGATNNYTPSVNGWLYVGSNDASYLALFDTGSGGCGIRFSDGVVGEKYACIPCQAGRSLGVRITCTNLAHAYFIPCQGNI